MAIINIRKYVLEIVFCTNNVKKQVIKCANYHECLLTNLSDQPGSSKASDISVSAETVIHEAFAVVEELGWGFSALLAWRKGKGQISLKGWTCL